MTTTPWLRWLLGLERVSPTAESLRIEWEHPLEGWVWLLVLCASVCIAYLAYAKTRCQGRFIMASCRALLVLLLVILFSRPMLVQVMEEREQDRVLVLIDRSMSMTVADATDNSETSARITRDSQARALLADPAWQAVKRSGKDIEWLGFSSTVSRLPQGQDGDPAMEAPNGWTTDISVALADALRRSQSGPTSAVIIISDGRSASPVDPAVLKSLGNSRLPVFTIPLGGNSPIRDVAVVQATAPSRAFVRDDIPVAVRVHRSGDNRGVATMVQLIDQDTGAVLDHKAVTDGEFVDGVADVSLVARGGEEGTGRWTVKVVSDAEDASSENDSRDLSVELIGRPIRVLYMDGYPRWEYRYLKNLMVREPSIDSSVMLLSADREFAQEGDSPLGRLPQTMEEMSRFDVVMIGDVPAGYLSNAQCEAMRESVAKRGMGLLWIGGPHNTPSTWRGNALEELLPMVPPLEIETTMDPVWVQPTGLAARLGVLRLDSSDDGHWPSLLAPNGASWSRLQWAQALSRSNLKPSVEVLAQSVGESESTNPLVTIMRYGAGQAIYVGTDETWRWRNGIGESLQERFWIGLIRLLARPAIEGGSSPVRLEATPTMIELGGTTLLRLEVLDSASGFSGASSVVVEVTALDGSSDQVTLSREDPQGSSFIGTWTPQATGSYKTKFEDLGAGLTTDLALDVVQVNDELSHPEPDHAQLATIASESGGRTLTQESLPQLPAMLPNRSVVLERTNRDPLWSSPMAMTLLLLLLVTEWAGRRLSLLE